MQMMPAPARDYSPAQVQKPATDIPDDTPIWARRPFGTYEKFNTREELATAIADYFRWNAANPLYQEKGHYNAKTNKIKKEKIAKMRAPTVSSLETFIGIAPKTWEKWRDAKPGVRDALGLADVSDLCKAAEKQCRDARIAGASADLLNAGFIAKCLGISEKVEQKITGDGSATGEPLVDPKTVANTIHPDDPDPTALQPDAVFPRPLWSPEQIAQGFPFFLPKPPEPTGD